jgi:hypothetical protein
MTARVSMMLKSRASLTCFRACVVTCPSVYVLMYTPKTNIFSFLNLDILLVKVVREYSFRLKLTKRVPACIVPWFSRVTCA